MSRKDFKLMVNQKQKWITPVVILLSVGVFFYVITSFNSKDALVRTSERTAITGDDDADGVVDLGKKGLDIDEGSRGGGDQGEDEQAEQGGGDGGGGGGGGGEQGDSESEAEAKDQSGKSEESDEGTGGSSERERASGGGADKEQAEGEGRGEGEGEGAGAGEGEGEEGEPISQDPKSTGGGEGAGQSQSGSKARGGESAGESAGEAAEEAAEEGGGAGGGKDPEEGGAKEEEEGKEGSTPVAEEAAPETATPAKEEEVDEDKDLDEPEPEEPSAPPAPEYSFGACPDEAAHAVPCRVDHTYRECPHSAPSCVVNAPSAYQSNHRHRPEAREKVSRSVLDPSVDQFEDELVEAGLISKDGEDYFFPGGAPQIEDVKAYIKTLEQMVPELAFGNRTRVALDINGGVGSLAAALSEKEVMAITVGGYSQKSAVQMQILAERNLAGVLGSFTRWQLPFAGHSFEMLHCGGCEVEWMGKTGLRGKPLLEADRVLRPGGYFVWTAKDVAEESAETWGRVQTLLTSQLCYTLVKRAKTTAVFRKPVNEDCRQARGADAHLPLCAEDAEESGYQAKLQSCISRLPRDGLASIDGLTDWPHRLSEFPPRLALAELGGINAKKEIWQADNKYWHAMSRNYVVGLGMKPEAAQAALDMRANLGGFAHGMQEHFPHVWTMNVVPVSAENTLDLILDRGLAGLVHDWCKPLDMPPRSFDLIHATYLFPHEMRRCDPGQIVLEVDRLIRPGGMIVMRERIETLEYVLPAGRAIKRWHIFVKDTESGPLGKDKLLVVHVGQEHN